MSAIGGTAPRERIAAASGVADDVTGSVRAVAAGRRDAAAGHPTAGPRPSSIRSNSVVDRGFDDVEEEGETRRVHWTILKRTTADQISRKPISAVYVLQRDGNDAEFPNLGSARSAVNKTIVHPEKLTRSKEEYAAEKNAKR